MMLCIVLFSSVIYLYSASPDTAELIAAADQLYQERGDLNKAFQAYEKYKELLKANPNQYEALWKAVRTAFYILEVLKNDRVERREPIVNEAIKFAKHAVGVNPGGVEGHLWLGVIYTKYGEVKGVLKALFLVRPTKKEMYKVIEINDAYEGAGAYVVLGRVFAKVPGLFGGSNNKAREYYEKARKMCSSNTLNLLYMAENYWDMDEKTLAIKTLEDLLAMEPDPRWAPETQMHKQDAAILLEKFKKHSK